MIVDETSMVDLQLMMSLLRALKPGCRLILVGDPDQLPSVGAGNVFPISFAAEKLRRCALQKFSGRRSRGLIVMNAHAVNRGELPDLSRKDKDFFFHAPQKPGGAGADGAGAVCGASSEEHGHRVVDIQVLRRPGRARPERGRSIWRCRRFSIRRRPESAKKHGEFSFREGDRVMQIRNNYDIMWKRSDGLGAGTGIFNGDIGTISRIDFEAELVSIDFDDRSAEYSFDMLRSWSLRMP